MSINLGDINMPINAVTKSFAILAKRGAGKSYTAGVMMEEFFKNNIPFVVLDPIDIHWGIKLNKDGKTKGLPVVVFGLQHEDIKLNKDMGRDIARAIVKNNVSCVISTFGMPKSQQRFLMTEFAEEILNINNTPRHIFIEEAHEMVPQRVMGDIGKCFNAVSNLVVMGRNRGLGVTLINQRASTINKDVLTQIDSLLAFRNVSPQDRKALREWVEYHSAEGDFNKFMDSLPSLPTGEGWIWSPEFLNLFRRIKIRERETFHPDREKIGDRFVMPVLDSTDIKTFIEQFQKEVSDDKESISNERVKDSSHDRCPVCGRRTVGSSGYCRKHFAIGINGIKHSEEQEQERFINLKNEFESKIIEKDRKIEILENMINNIKLALEDFADDKSIKPIENKNNLNLWLEKLGDGMPNRILAFLGQKSGMSFTKSQIALACGYSAKGGGFNNAISLLKQNLLIIKEGDRIKVNPDL